MQAEKQELTILFCDILGSTELTEKLELDDFLVVMQSYHECIYQCISSQYGYVAQHLGDGIMAYFGFPTKYAGAPVYAIKAGLSLLKEVNVLAESLKVRFAVDLKIRVSIHTGVVIMADLGIGGRKERLALGGTPNIAARLEALAPINGIVVSHDTYLQSESHFEFKALGHHVIKGVAETMPCYQPISTLCK